MKLTCYPTRPGACEIVPGRQERAWMDEYRHAYRCLPLTIANTSGWELLTPLGFRATWNGGLFASDITFEATSPSHPNAYRAFVNPHFSHGILTFSAGYLFQTEPGWDLMVSGPPNWIKHGIQPLCGIVETDWLSYGFTMNWRFTAPGTVEFAAGEPFAFITPVPHAAVDDFEPVIKSLDAEPELKQRNSVARISREEFTKRIIASDPAALQEAWQKHYFNGIHADGSPGSPAHVNKRRLKPPRREV